MSNIIKATAIDMAVKSATFYIRKKEENEKIHYNIVDCCPGLFFYGNFCHGRLCIPLRMGAGSSFFN